MADFIQGVLDGVRNLPKNLYGTLANATNMNLHGWIRIVAIVGAYLLLRPYLLKWAGQAQEKQHEKLMKSDQAGAQAKISPNSLRGQVEVPEDTDEEDGDESQASGANWGKKARKRQRQFVQKVLDDEERRRLEEEDEQDDKDIEEFLVKYTSIKTQLDEEEE